MMTICSSHDTRTAVLVYLELVCAQLTGSMSRVSLHLPRKGHEDMPDNSLLFLAVGLGVMRLRTFHAEGSSTLLISGGIHVPKTSVQEAILACMNNTVYIVIQNTLCRKPYKDEKENGSSSLTCRNYSEIKSRKFPFLFSL